MSPLFVRQNHPSSFRPNAHTWLSQWSRKLWDSSKGLRASIEVLCTITWWRMWSTQVTISRWTRSDLRKFWKWLKLKLQFSMKAFELLNKNWNKKLKEEWNYSQLSCLLRLPFFITSFTSIFLGISWSLLLSFWPISTYSLPTTSFYWEAKITLPRHGKNR